jgi:hypothetical protein
MESSDLFSHPYKPESVSSGKSSSEPTEAPAFSDRPQTDSSADKPSSS